MMKFELLYSIMSKIAIFLVNLHSIKQIHGNLKISNVLISKTPGREGQESIDVRVSDYWLTEQMHSEAIQKKIDSRRYVSGVFIENL